MIAMVLSCNRSLLIADGLQIVLGIMIQTHICELMKELQAEFRISVMYIAYDLGLMAEISDEVLVMYWGEDGRACSCGRGFSQSSSPYTLRLLE